MRLALAAAAAALVFWALPADSAGLHITGDTVWSGEVRVDGPLVVDAGATLTVAPGTVVAFDPAEPDEEGLAGTGILVSGRLVAKGEPDARIRFTSSSESPAPGDWGEIKIFESEGCEFTDCDFGFGGWGIHVHDSVLVVEGCTFAGNSFGGLRGKGGSVEIADSSFTGMKIGIRYWQGAPSIHGCTITGNGTGIFFRQECGKAAVHGNNIYGNIEYDLKLGDAHYEDLDASGNWWGTKDTSEIGNKIFDRRREGYIGRVLIDPVLAGMAGPDMAGDADGRTTTGD